jgi:aldoxime dehydratase
MESAIPQHLQTRRTRQNRLPQDYTPPYPSFVARFTPGVKRVAMAYFGLQYRGEAPDEATNSLDQMSGALSTEHGPGHWDLAIYIDEAGYTNVITIAYWDDAEVFDAWFTTRGGGWTRDDRAHDGVGYFTEVLRPRVDHFETLFSADNRAEGIAVLADGMSDTVLEHAYWGGARDRIPRSQTDDMVPAGSPGVVTEEARRRIIPHENLCLIRSGQDWGDTGAEERRMYLQDVEPVLRRGMDFLRDDGLSVGCFANRYMRVMDAEGGVTDKSFGMSLWKSLAALESWAESHPTHVAIFAAAMKHLSTLGPAAQLKLYHEVTVATADEQFFEYLNCHDRTGMLRAR